MIDWETIIEGLNTASFALPRPCAAHRYALFVAGMGKLVMRFAQS